VDNEPYVIKTKKLFAPMLIGRIADVATYDLEESEDE
jgi:hypothetical protein